jgi:predicted nucleic acid-binding protein
VIYLDTSALARLIVRETETAALGQWLHQRTAQLWVTSIIGRVELLRVARRFASAMNGARLLLAGLDTIPLVDHVADLAQAAGSVTLRTLDAIHLASALSVRDELTAFCCYDHRLLDAAKEAGLPIHTPGR